MARQRRTPNSRETTASRAYRRRVRAWTLYDWANSAFATTVMAAVLPVYYSQVAAATLPDRATATAYWSTGLSISLLITALLAPILGTLSDLKRNKKQLLGLFAATGMVATALLGLVERGDWLLASCLFIVARVGFGGANVFYDALLPHVAKPEEQDAVSARGYAVGYLGGGLLLAINIAMIRAFEGTLGPRLAFVSVAVWWAVFSVPLFRHVPEPPAAQSDDASGLWSLRDSFARLWRTLQQVRRYRQLFTFLLATFIYNDGIGTVIGLAAIYGAELGFSSTELLAALLLVQFVGIPFSLLFGFLPAHSGANDPGPKRPRRWFGRGFALCYLLVNVVGVPLAAASIRFTHIEESGAGVAALIVIGAVQLLALSIAAALGRWAGEPLAARLTTKSVLGLGLVTYAMICVWGYALASITEFWCLAWMVALVQGGTQALSRSLYASMTPAACSGEFFGLYGVMEKFSAVIGPLLFAAAIAVFGSSRPAILALVLLFVAGAALLARVDVAEARRLAN